MNRTLTVLVLFLIAIVCSCAPLTYNTHRAIIAVTGDAQMQAYLATITVRFVAGAPYCGGHFPDEQILGCYHAGGEIDVSTIQWDRTPPWRTEDEILRTLAHEYIHAMQYKTTGFMWHPVW